MEKIVFKQKQGNEKKNCVKREIGKRKKRKKEKKNYHELHKDWGYVTHVTHRCESRWDSPCDLCMRDTCHA